MLGDLEAAWLAGSPAPTPDALAEGAGAAKWDEEPQPTLRGWLEASVAAERERRGAIGDPARSARRVHAGSPAARESCEGPG
jgi:hypothetical protein